MHVFVLTALALVLVLGSVGCRKQRTKEEMLKNLTPENARLLDPMQSTPLVVAGIESPRLYEPADLEVPDDWEVIGVVLADQPRAYLTRKMSGMMEHVVNDSVTQADGNPLAFTITFCDQTDCARVLTFANPSTASTTGIGTLGMLDGGLALRWQEHQFKQTDTPEGLRELPFERTTWGAWKEKYPQSKIYAGPRASELQPAKANDVEPTPGQPPASSTPEAPQ
jgi:hypothetical protein